MKAKDYFEKYDLRIINEKSSEAKELAALISEMSKEMVMIKESRKIKTNRALVSLVNEQNQKWNALANLFEKKYGGTILKRNGFKNFWFEQMPELKLFQKGM